MAKPNRKTLVDRLKEKAQEGTLIKDGQKVAKNRFNRWFRHNNAMHYFDTERLLTKAYLGQFQPINQNHYKVGNYYLDKRVSLTKKSVVYSLGILTDVDFDRALSRKVLCEVFMYDPTPRSIAFMEQYKDDPYFRFFPYGVWTENTVLTFAFPESGGSASAVHAGVKENSFQAECKDIACLMEENGHIHIDVLKMDIEGAALPITEYLIEKNIYPTQIVVEYERPRKNMDEVLDFFYRVKNCVQGLKDRGYEVYKLPRNKAKYFSLELLFVKPE